MPTETGSPKTELLQSLYEIDDLESAACLLAWDQATYMPAGGAAARARQLATLRRLAHEKLIAPEFAKQLEKFERSLDDSAYGSDDAALARAARRNYDRAANVPPAFLHEFTEHTAACYTAWTQARPANDFAAIKPFLEKTLDLSKRYADFFPDHAHVADPLIESSDFGMTVATIRPIFSDLRDFLTPFAQEIQDGEPVAELPASARFDIEAQRQAAIDIATRFGYDFSRGRLDKTHHPFMIKFSLGDARITTRYSEENLSAVFGTMHEAGHAMYEQGISRSYERTPLADGTSSAVHESQSRSWENIVGRSRHFWSGYYDRLQAHFPDALRDVPMDAFYRAINRVAPSLIRVDADEVTYALHVIIRFELELEMLEGALDIAHLPEAWNAKYAEYLGVTPPDDRDGVLQDVHWYTDYIGGMFQGYALGNVLASQFYDVALKQHPEITSEIESGHFDTLRGWLTENIYQHGSKYTTLELVERITGGAISTDPYKRYLRAKYSDIYGLDGSDAQPTASALP